MIHEKGDWANLSGGWELGGEMERVCGEWSGGGLGDKRENERCEGG